MDYFQRQPVGWREDLRTYYIMSSMAGNKTKAEDIFPSIKQLKQAEEHSNAQVARSFKASPFYTKMQEAHAKAGKKI